MTTYSVYFGRYSSDQQEKGDSQRRQDTGFSDHLNRTKTLSWGERYFDAGVSGWDRDGTGGEHRKTGDFGRLLRDVEARAFPQKSIIWFENLDRFGREDPFIYTVPTLQGILKAGYRVTIGTENFDHSDLKNPWRMVGVVCRAIGNKEHSDKTSLRLGESWTGKRKAGDTFSKKMGRKSKVCPSWITLSEKTGEYELNEWSKVIYRACTMAIEDYGFTQIQRKLGHKLAGLKKIFHQRTLVGEWQEAKRQGKNKRVYTGGCHKIYPALLTENEWQKLQASIKSRTLANGKPRGGNGGDGPNLFKSLMFVE